MSMQKHRNLPRLKAWRYFSGMLVIARSRRRAAELVGTTAYCIMTHWERPDGKWWYKYAVKESVWITPTGKESTTGEYLRFPSHDECEAILRDELEEFRTMPMTKLKDMIGQERVRDRTGADGVPCNVEIAIDYSGYEPPIIEVCADIAVEETRWCCDVMHREVMVDNSEIRWQEYGF